MLKKPARYDNSSNPRGFGFGYTFPAQSRYCHPAVPIRIIALPGSVLDKQRYAVA
jgi:hypothetical protein